MQFIFISKKISICLEHKNGHVLFMWATAAFLIISKKFQCKQWQNVHFNFRSCSIIEFSSCSYEKYILILLKSHCQTICANWKVSNVQVESSPAQLSPVQWRQYWPKPRKLLNSWHFHWFTIQFMLLPSERYAFRICASVRKSSTSKPIKKNNRSKMWNICTPNWLK